jgi:hypothetical protein
MPAEAEFMGTNVRSPLYRATYRYMASLCCEGDSTILTSGGSADVHTLAHN